MCTVRGVFPVKYRIIPLKYFNNDTSLLRALAQLTNDLFLQGLIVSSGLQVYNFYFKDTYVYNM